jgi:hypothetical protein
MLVTDPNKAAASKKRPSAVSCIHSGMGLHKGHPVTQLGFGTKDAAAGLLTSRGFVVRWTVEFEEVCGSLGGRALG